MSQGSDNASSCDEEDNASSWDETDMRDSDVYHWSSVLLESIDVQSILPRQRRHILRRSLKVQHRFMCVCDWKHACPPLPASVPLTSVHGSMRAGLAQAEGFSDRKRAQQNVHMVRTNTMYGCLYKLPLPGRKREAEGGCVVF
jgi:hypothetical protein